MNRRAARKCHMPPKDRLIDVREQARGTQVSLGTDGGSAELQRLSTIGLLRGWRSILRPPPGKPCTTGISTPQPERRSAYRRASFVEPCDSTGGCVGGIYTLPALQTRAGLAGWRKHLGPGSALRQRLIRNRTHDGRALKLGAIAPTSPDNTRRRRLGDEKSTRTGAVASPLLRRPWFLSYHRHLDSVALNIYSVLSVLSTDMPRNYGRESQVMDEEVTDEEVGDPEDYEVEAIVSYKADAFGKHADARFAFVRVHINLDAGRCADTIACI